MFPRSYSTPLTTFPSHLLCLSSPLRYRRGRTHCCHPEAPLSGQRSGACQTWCVVFGDPKCSHAEVPSHVGIDSSGRLTEGARSRSEDEEARGEALAEVSRERNCWSPDRYYNQRRVPAPEYQPGDHVCKGNPRSRCRSVTRANKGKSKDISETGTGV